MKPDERCKLINLLKERKCEYHQKLWWEELVAVVFGQRGGRTDCGFWSSNQNEDDTRRSVNLRRRMLRAGIIQTTRERGRYRIIAEELDAVGY